jgi:putative ABC transport system permease protein
VVIAAVCLYVLVQMLTLTAQERRRAVAVLRTIGAARSQVAAVLGGSALLVAGCGAGAGVLLERLVVGPAAAGLAASYVSLPLVAGARDTIVVALGLAFLALLASAWVARAAVRQPIVAGLREE